MNIDLYFILLSILLFLLMLFDKNQARTKQKRIPEALLLLLAFVGGSLGGLLGMYLFHHKTKKPIFKWGFLVLTLFNFFCLYLLKQ